MCPQICFNVKVGCAVLAVTGLSFMNARRIAECTTCLEDMLSVCFKDYDADKTMTACPQCFDQYGYDFFGGGIWCIQLMLLSK
jgi:hypothetical protein